MAEFSMWWTTGGAGDGSATYTRTDHAMWSKVLASCNGMEGVAPNYLNKLAGTVTALNTVQINTGGGLVDGKAYNNSAAVNVNIPSAVGAGNTRIDRIVLRADWTAQTVRITRIAGTDAASPTAPAITQVSGTTYDIMLYRALVNTAGTVTLTDERVNAQVQTADVADLAVTTAKIAASAIITSRIADGNVTNSKLGASSVDSDQYVDGSIDTAHLGNLQVTQAKMAANSVDSDQYVDGSIDTAHLANDAVDDTKVGNRVPQLYRRLGGSATDWNVAGVTGYTPGAVRMQIGAVNVTIPADMSAGSTVVTFPVAFSGKPLVLVSSMTAAYNDITLTTSTITTTQVTVAASREGSIGYPERTVVAALIAIGPE